MGGTDAMEYGGLTRNSRECVDVSVLILGSEGKLDTPLPAVDSTTLRACVVVASVESSVRGVDSTTLRECVQVVVAGVELSMRGVDSTTLQEGRVLWTTDIHGKAWKGQGTRRRRNDLSICW